MKNPQMTIVITIAGTGTFFLLQALYTMFKQIKMNIDMHETPEENTRYQHYQELGGIINEADYESALARAESAGRVLGTPEKERGKEPGNMAKFAGIELNTTEGALDQRIVLYRILRSDAKPEGVTHHHSQMSDQRLFAEVLRMIGDTDALNKLMDVYHKAGAYCPICLKIAISGEECR